MVARRRKYTGPERRHMEHHSSGGWTFKKQLSVDTILQIVGMAVVLGGPAILAWRSMETRILTLENIYVQTEKRDTERSKLAEEQRNALGLQLKELSDAVRNLQASFYEVKAQLGITANVVQSLQTARETRR